MLNHLASQLHLQKRIVRISRWLLVLTTSLLLLPWPTGAAREGGNHSNALSLQQPAQAQGGTQITPQGTLEVGKPIERELAGGQGHSYQISLTAGQYLEAVVEQRGIDVVVMLFGPDGKKLVEVDSPNGTQGPEPVLWIVEAIGGYRLEVRALEKDAKVGRYDVKIKELRPATVEDRASMEAQKLDREASNLNTRRRYNEAILPAERSLDIREKALGPEHPDVAVSLTNLAIVYSNKGDYAKAESLHQRALAIREKVLGPEHPDVAQSLSNLARTYNNKADFAKSEPLYQRALAIREKALGPDHQAVASSLNNLALLYDDKGDYAKAELLYHRALLIKERGLGLEHPEVGIYLNNLAELYKNKGDYAKAEPLMQRTLAIWEKARGPEHPDVAAVLHNLGILYVNKGDYVKAESLYQRALFIKEKVLGADHQAMASSLNSLAILYTKKGDYAKAEPLYQRTLTIWEKTRGPDHPNVAGALTNLAILYMDKGDYAKAESLNQRALAIWEKALGPEHPNVAQSLTNLAILHSKKGDYEKAEPLYQRALTIGEKMLGPEHSDVARYLNNLGGLNYNKGDYAKAEPLYQRSLAIREKALGLEHPDVAQSLNRLAMLYEAKGDVSRAITFQLRATSVSERNIILNLTAGSERQKLAYLATLSGESDRAVSLHVRSTPNDSAARNLALTIVLQRKGRALDATTDGIAALSRRARSQDQALLDQLKDTNTQLAWLVLNGPQKATSAEHQQRIKTLDDQKEKLEAEISSRSAEFRALSQPVTLAAVQAATPANAALVEFFSYRPFNAKYTKPDEQFGQPRYVAYLLRRQGEAQWVELGEAKVIDDAVGALRQALCDPADAKQRFCKPDEARQRARKLDQLVMQPVRKLLGDTKHILISPDGALNLIPFAALVDERGEYLIRRYAITYLTSGRDLLRLQIARESKSVPLVVADPIFGEPATNQQVVAQASAIAKLRERAINNNSDLGGYLRSFEKVAGAEDEAKRLKRILPEATVLTQQAATETALKQANAPRILHISTHGFFLDDLAMTPENERRARSLRGGSVMSSEAVSASSLALLENPLLVSGLALAGANQRKSGDDDGILTALEVAGLDLWGTKLVTLSACDTGVGRVKNGEGVYGLRRALVLAGAESQVMSLWKVDGYATRNLMADYYERLKLGEGRGNALRQAQLKMLSSAKRRHPFYWASFIQSGEWANLDGRR